MSFDNTCGLDPKIVAKLNNNFWYLANMFTDPEIVAVASVNPPSPRTNETLWYETTTGDLHLWSVVRYDESEDPDNPGETIVSPVWDWLKLEVNLIHLSDEDPTANDVPDRTTVFWYNTETGNMFVWGLVNTAQAGSNPVIEWRWLKMDINMVKAENDAPPLFGEQTTSDYQYSNEIIRYSYTNKMFYLLMQPHASTVLGSPVNGWYSIEQVMLYWMQAFMENNVGTIGQNLFALGVAAACEAMTQIQWEQCTGLTNMIDMMIQSSQSS